MPTDALVLALKAEEVALERTLEQDPVFRRLTIVRTALKDLEALPKTVIAHANGHDWKPEVAASIPHAAELAIESAGHPIATRALLAELSKYGKSVGGTKPAVGLSSTLSAHEKFESVDWDGLKAWWIKGKPLPRNDSSQKRETEAVGASVHP